MEKKNKKDKVSSSVITVVCLLAVIVSSCCGYMLAGHFNPEFKEKVEGYLSSLESGETTESEKKDSLTARFMCAGDNIIHSAIYEQAEKDEGYDFSYVYKEIKSVIGKSDIAMINQATLLSGNIKPSSYPTFCSPLQVGDALSDVGFSVINHANKNIGDKGDDGIKDTYDYWTNKSDVILSGLYASKEDTQVVPTKEVNGIKFGFMGVTEDINKNISEDEGVPYVISLNQKGKTTAEVYNELKSIIKKAKTDCDVLVLYVNFDGNEKEEPTSSQKDIAGYLVSFGADVVVGSGTYTVQPMEIKETIDGRKAVIAYSLGNFVSAQNSKENMLSGILDIVFVKDEETGKTDMKYAKIVPVITMIEERNTNIRVLPLSSADEETINSHSIRGMSKDYIDTYYSENIGEEYLEKNVIDTQIILSEIEKTSQEDGSDLSTDEATEKK